MRNRMYGGVRGRKTKVGRKLLRFPPTRFFIPPEPLFHPQNTAFQLQNEYIIRAERPLLPCKTITIAEQKESFGKAKVVL